MPLLVGMGTILVVTVLTVMIGVGYCLHKGWSLPKITLRGYRNLYLHTDLDHTNQDVFTLDNDFAKFKSYNENDGDSKNDSMVEDEDDIDNVNLNIHLDVLSAGQEYLSIFGEKKHERRTEKQQRKSEVIKLMAEIEQMISVIGSDAMIQGMQLFDENQEDEEDEEEGDGAARQRKKKGAEMAGEEGKKKEEDKEAEDKRREQVMKEWGDRDRNLLEQAKNEA